MTKQRTFRIDDKLLADVDAVRIPLGLNRTQYLRRALKAAVHADRSAFPR